MAEVNAQLQLLKHYITPEIQELVRYGFLEGGRFLVKRRLGGWCGGQPCARELGERQ
jgi:hypothetical protein